MDQDRVEENVELEGEDQRLNLTDSQRAQLAVKVIKNYDEAENEMREWKFKKAEGLRLLLGLMKEKSFPFKDCANINVPLIRTVKETLASNLVNSFDYENPIEASPVGPEDTTKAKKISRFLNWQFTNEISSYRLVDEITDSVLTYGHVVPKVRYVKEERDGDVLFDGVKIDIPNPEDLLFPPWAITDDVDKLDFIMQRIYMTRSDILKRQRSGVYDEVEIPEKFMQDDRNYEILEWERKRYQGLAQIFRVRPEGIPTVLEWYGFYDYDGDGIEESVCVTMLKETKTVLRCIKWVGSRPFVIIRVSPMLNSPFGESVGDLLMRINQELNTLHNQRVDAVTITNLPFGFYDPMVGLSGQLNLTPGALIPVNGNPTQAVYFPQLSIVKPEMYREEELLFSYAERLLGAGANVQGAINPRRLSATEVQIVDRRSGIRFFTLFMRIRDGLGKLARLVFEFDQKYFPPEKQIRVLGITDAPFMGKEWFPFSKFVPEDMQAKVDIVFKGHSIVDVQADKQEKMNVYQLAIQNPLVQQDQMGLYNLTIDTMKSLGVDNPDRYIRPPAVTMPKSPEEEHTLIAQGEQVEVNMMDDFHNHLAKHADFINSDKFKMIPKEYQLNMIKHYQSTRRVKQTLDELDMIRQQGMMLNQGGQFNAPTGTQFVPGQQPQQPAQPPTELG